MKNNLKMRHKDKKVKYVRYRNRKKNRYIINPGIGTIVRHTGFDRVQDSNYPCDVYIIAGQYKDSQFGRLSNHWEWRRILPDGTLSEIECGYGSFEKSSTKYSVEIIIKAVK